MVAKLEYDFFVKRLNPATVAVLALALMGSAARAQTNSAQAKGVPASVTSTGFGGSNAPRGTPASVTSRGFGSSGRTPTTPPSVTSQGFARRSPGFTSHPQPSHHPRHDHDGPHHPQAGGVYAVPYYYPYAYGSDVGEYDSNQQSEDDATADEDQGGPTIFDRRGTGSSRAVQEDYADQGPVQTAAPLAREADEPVSDQPGTLLIFKDGHQLEVSNYAIVGSMLFDLSAGQRHKIPLSELNLTATMKENDDRGIDFQLPGGFRAN
jgi:hypothetical protein